MNLVERDFAAYAAASKLLDDYVDFALSIGCVVIQDEIVSDTAQAKQLAAWWLRKAGG